MDADEVVRVPSGWKRNGPTHVLHPGGGGVLKEDDNVYAAGDGRRFLGRFRTMTDAVMAVVAMRKALDAEEQR